MLYGFEILILGIGCSRFVCVVVPREWGRGDDLLVNRKRVQKSFLFFVFCFLYCCCVSFGFQFWLLMGFNGERKERGWEMKRDGESLNRSTFCCALSACADISALGLVGFYLGKIG